MTKRILFLAVIMILGVFTMNAQEDDDAFRTPIITDEMTIDEDQNKRWRMGQYRYSAKPKNVWELGLHAGHMFIDGDVDRTLPGGFGVGVHLRKAINYIFSVRLDGFYGKATGLDPQRSLWGPLSQNGTVGALYNNDDVSFNRNHQTDYIGGAIQGVANIGNILFHRERNKWNFNVILGAGFYTWTANLDLVDGSGNIYNTRAAISGLDINKQNDRREIKDKLRQLYDGVYETKGYQKDGIFRLGDETNFLTQFHGGVGVMRKLNKRINIGLEHMVMVSDNDYMDGYWNRTRFDQTNNVDVPHYTNVRLAINLGNFDEKTEPLYWLNPLDGALNDIATLKSRPKFEVTDADCDGVIDMVDMEMNTKGGCPTPCPVDTRGVILDSDGDGCPDCEDAEPYSPPGYEIVNCVAVIPEDPPVVAEVDEPKIISLIKQHAPKGGTTVTTAAATDWYLPMIHFDLDKYYIKPEFYPQLHHVATVMKSHPYLCVSAVGHTDVRMPNDYNRVLSYNRAKAAIDYIVTAYNIPRDRFKLMYGGEDSPLVAGLPDHHNISKQKEMQQYMNRRVEFKVCDGSEINMGLPSGKQVGKNTPCSSRPGPKYSGNTSSGY